jgi:hypothetical protein
MLTYVNDLLLFTLIVGAPASKRLAHGRTGVLTHPRAHPHMHVCAHTRTYARTHGTLPTTWTRPWLTPPAAPPDMQDLRDRETCTNADRPQNMPIIPHESAAMHRLLYNRAQAALGGLSAASRAPQGLRRSTPPAQLARSWPASILGRRRKTEILALGSWPRRCSAAAKWPRRCSAAEGTAACGARGRPPGLACSVPSICACARLKRRAPARLAAAAKNCGPCPAPLCSAAL